MTYTLVMRRIPALAITAFVLVLLGACSAPNSDVASTSSVVSETTSVSQSDVTARIIGDGSSFSLQEALVQTPVAFWFWAPG